MTGRHAGVVLWYDQTAPGEWANCVVVTHNYQGGLSVSEFVDGDHHNTPYSSPHRPNNRFLI
jgi:hypothetical protein